MSTISGFSSAGVSSGLSAATVLPPLATPALAKGQKAAREFEAELIGSVLESMEKSFAAVPGQDEMAGDDNYNYLGTRALASAMADAGGFGIARMISEHLGGTKVTPEGAEGTVPKPISGQLKSL